MAYWNLVNRVIKEADVIIEVLDARLIDETRNSEIEAKIKENKKKLIHVINKADLVDKKALDKKKKELANCVFVSTQRHYGTTILLKKILKIGNKEKIVVGVVGYPNTGKSSLINALAGRSKARTSSFSGFTKGIQKIRANRRIMLIDTPGVIPFSRLDEATKAILGAVDFSKVKEPDIAAAKIVRLYKPQLLDYYGLALADDKNDEFSIIEKLALHKKKLKKNAEPDIELMSRIIIKDWQKGKINISGHE